MGCHTLALKSVEDCVRLEEAGLADYVQSSTRPLMVAVAKEGLQLQEKTLAQKQLKEQKRLEWAEGWKNKPLHGQFLHQTEEIRDDATWDWLTKPGLKKETERMITAVQDQALRTNAIKAKVEKQNLSPLCRMCGEKDESMGRLVEECSKLAQTEHQHRHDNVARMIHWNIAHSYGLDVSNKWHEH